MKKWEYSEYVSEINNTLFLSICNQKGQEGWELCSMQWGNGNVYTVWKREVEESKKYSQQQIDSQIEEAKRVLLQLEVPEVFINKMCCLTFLALCSIVPGAAWCFATNQHMGLTKDIMEFIADNYNMQYKSGTRESFRREGINVLMRFNIIDINPGDPNLGPNSPKVHYAIKESVLTTIRKSDKQAE